MQDNYPDLTGDQVHSDLAPFEPRRIRSGAVAEQLRYRFLRIVTRVYLVGAVDVSVLDHSDFAGDLGFGKTGLKNNLQVISDLSKQSDAYKNLLSALNKGLIGQDDPTSKPAENTGKKDTSAPSTGGTDSGGSSTAGGSGGASTTGGTTTGGTSGSAGGTSAPATTTGAADSVTDALPDIGARVKIVSVSDRSISLREKFVKPLVVGYIAVDVPIGVGGQLGSRPVDTFKRVALNHNDRRDAARAIHDWIEYHGEAEDFLDSWGNANTTWLAREGFSDFVSAGKYKAGSLGRYFRSTMLDQFAIRAGSFFSGRPWTALYNRIAEEIVLAPDGVFGFGTDEAPAKPTHIERATRTFEQLAR